MNIDKNILAVTIDGMTIPQRREWLIKILMAQHGTTFDAIAKKKRSILPLKITLTLT